MKTYTKEERKLIKKIAKKNNVSETCIRQRLCFAKYDFSKVDYPSKERRIKYYYQGKPAVDVAKENGISKNKFNSRVKNGWSIEKACTFNEPSLKELAYKTTLSYEAIRSWVYNKGISKKYILENYKKDVDIKKNMI